MTVVKQPRASSSRRSFLAGAGGLSIASLLGCVEREPPEDIVPYALTPEYIVPGRPLWFASAMVHAGYAYGTLVESHTGRPSKIEGHPDHPSSLGATDAFGQALIRDFVDDSRTRTVLHHGLPSSQGSFYTALRRRLAALGPRRELAILSGRITSPTTVRMIEALARKHPSLRWHCWEPISEHDALVGAREVLGRELLAVPRLEHARVVVSLDDDIFSDRPGRLAHARAFAGARAPQLGPSEALRLYVAESFPSITGAVADHRESLRHDRIAELADALLAAILREAPRAGSSFVELAAEDLRRAGPAALVLAGPGQPPRVHALAQAINHLLNAAGRTVAYYERFARGPIAGVESLTELAEALRAGQVDTLILLDDVNPIYDAPPELELDRLIPATPLVVHHGLRLSESAVVADWHVPAAHPLESWADARGHDGTPTLLQPLIRPLFAGLTAAELLAALFDQPASARALVRATWAERAPSGAAWQRAVHDGRLANDRSPVQTSLAPRAVAALAVPIERPRAELLLAFRPDPTLFDGRYASNPWLQELPKPISTIAWGNAAFVAAQTASARGLEDDQVVRLSIDGRSVDAPIRTLVDHPPDQITVHLGHGRRHVDPETGVDVYPLRIAAGLWARAGLELAKLDERRPVIEVQQHHRLYGRALVREATREQYLRAPAQAFAAPEDPPPQHPPPSLHPDRPIASPAWAMTIDLGACIGCSACVVACQAENNIPTVGPEQVRVGREMHWLRVDRYELDDGRTMFQPVLCMQCEHAPCEVVCPTGATVHSDSGLNDMVYNRCVGTRYCNNNCPYKVRRFNFFRYAPRDGLIVLGRNPDVSVRSRGVMEKCTYCVQRIHAGRRRARREGRELGDGDIKTACQQACPTVAIEFGDLGMPGAAVLARKAEPRNYTLLAELGTRPRTSYLGRLCNPNPAAHADEERS